MSALSAFWSRYPEAAAWPCLLWASAAASAFGIASDPLRERGLRIPLTGAGLALALYAFNILSRGLWERWTLGTTLWGHPIDHHPFGNRNSAALLLAALLPPALALARKRPLWGLSMTATLLGLLIRADALGACLGLGAGAWVLLPPGRARRLGLLVLLLGGAWAAWILPDGWRLETTLGLRSFAWEASLRGWREAPLLGLGSGSLTCHFPGLASTFYADNIHAAPRISNGYNLPLQILAETGVVGLGLALASLFFVARAWQGPWWAAWTAAALLFQSLGSDALLNPLGLACFAAAAGLGLSPPGTGRPRPVLALLTLTLTLALSGTLLAQCFAYARGHWAREDGNLEEARAAFARVARGLPLPLQLDALFRKGNALAALGRPREALAAYEELLAHGGPWGNGRREAGRAALEAGEPDRGRCHLEAHLDYLPTDTEALDLLAQADPQAAARREALFLARAEHLPGRHGALREAALRRAARGDWKEAWTLFGKAHRAYPLDSLILENAAVSGLYAGRAREALDLLQAASPACRDLLLQEAEAPGLRSLLRAAAGDRPGALEDLRAVSPETHWRPALEEAIGAPGALGSSGPLPAPPGS